MISGNYLASYLDSHMAGRVLQSLDVFGLLPVAVSLI